MTPAWSSRPIGPEPPPGARSGLQAWDPVNQKLRWNIAGGGGIGGGTTTTAGNLVFQVINDGRFRAISADKGEVLYEVQTNRTGMAPPITYEVDGTQYVAFGGGLGRATPNIGPDQRQGRERADDVRVRARRQGAAAASAADAAHCGTTDGSGGAGSRAAELAHCRSSASEPS